MVSKLAKPEKTNATTKVALVLAFAGIVLLIAFIFGPDSEKHIPKASRQQISSEPQSIAAAVFRSVVLIEVKDRSGQPLSLASGFFVGKGLVATNTHVLRGGYAATMNSVGSKSKVDVSSIVGFDEGHDLAIMQVPDASPALNLSSIDPVVGERIYVVGNPQGLEGTFSDGLVSAKRDVSANLSVLQITAPISAGSSGGPVVNQRGEVVGIAVATLRDGQNLNFAIPSKYLAALLRQPSEPRALREVAVSAKRSAMEELGRPSATGVSGRDIVWDDEYGQDGDFTFSIVNSTRDAIRNVRCVVIFYGKDGKPIDLAAGKFSGTIPPGLARRTRASVDPSTIVLTTPHDYIGVKFLRSPKTKTDIRVLDFDVAN
jgi:S1-C subfamily serine protease